MDRCSPQLRSERANFRGLTFPVMPRRYLGVLLSTPGDYLLPLQSVASSGELTLGKDVHVVHALATFKTQHEAIEWAKKNGISRMSLAFGT
jgi:hypothetical protein